MTKLCVKQYIDVYFLLIYSLESADILLEELSAHNLTSPCNSDCTCINNVFSPVCGHNSITYFSACHAGCRISANGTGEVSCEWSNCFQLLVWVTGENFYRSNLFVAATKLLVAAANGTWLYTFDINIADGYVNKDMRRVNWGTYQNIRTNLLWVIYI